DYSHQDAKQPQICRLPPLTVRRRGRVWGRTASIKATIAGVVGIFICDARMDAAWIVFDPVLHQQQILSTVQEVAKFVEMIGNQVSQLQELREQVSTLHHYVDLFGDPSSVVPVSA